MNRVLSFGAALTVLLATGAPGQTVDQYQVKAAFLYNFAKFVEWPAHTFKLASDPIVICVLGENPFGQLLEETVRGKSVDGRALAVRQVSELRQPYNCQILFVGTSDRPRRRAILGQIGSAAILTVGEAEGFAEEGGVVNFTVEGGKLRFQINPDAAERANLRISSKLLSLAQIVRR